MSSSLYDNVPVLPNTANRMHGDAVSALKHELAHTELTDILEFRLQYKQGWNSSKRLE
jgi:hypothetical protein